jgi:hypothetical protein
MVQGERRGEAAKHAPLIPHIPTSRNGRWGRHLPPGISLPRETGDLPVPPWRGFEVKVEELFEQVIFLEVIADQIAGHGVARKIPMGIS